MHDSALRRSLGFGRRREDARPTDGRPRLDLGAILALVVCGGYVLWVQFGFATPLQNKLFSNYLSPLVAGGCFLWSVWGFRLHGPSATDRRGRLSALFLSLGVLGYAIGSVFFTYYDNIAHQTPFPSWADAGYVVQTISLIVGVVLLPSRPLPGVMRIRILLDSLMVLAALVTFSWYFWLGPVALDGQTTLLARVLGAAYPILDLAMLFCAFALASHSQEPSVRRIRNLLLWAIVGYVTADTVFGYQGLQGTYQAGRLIDVGWMFANFMTARSAVALRNLRDEGYGVAEPAGVDVQAPSVGRAMAPYVLVPGVAALVVYAQRVDGPNALATGTYCGAGALLTLILIRQVCAIAENSRLYRFLHAAYRELESFATTDAMTGLANHRIFQERLRTEIERTEKSGAKGSLLLIDVDRFKQYNDRFGHPAGDEALRIVARVLRESIRASDLPARYGGEEFAAILPETEIAEAMAVAERLRAACEATEFPHREVTLSIGVAEIRGQTANALIEAADHALYAAKHGGRNQIALETTMLTKEGDASRTAGSNLPEGWTLEASRALGIDRLSVAESKGGPGEPIVRALLAMLELRDHDVERRSDRVMGFCLRLVQELNARGQLSISADELNDLHLGTLLHDIGKVGVPDAILNKPGALTEAEWQVVRRHPIEGSELIASFPQLLGAMPIVRSHHERWDGTGYPDGLYQKAIPFGARLFALADTLDAMGSDRPYRKARSYEEIREEVRRMSEKQFDPRLVEAFLAVPEAEWQAIREEGQEWAKAA